ncbi:hypothetical protein [Psychromarinibacter halotolerans]|uniref:Sulfotransferase family protein n=1 Tax=Psychromarinibacter halotolerans TaxID=1775175 RepID=A0ABV7GRH3_9RHOB|nr:hypothetical protein [Psychromarinibacter halotolerans]MDF0596673.1 hypothetical protein [Psychromarinibacter halotolerans]
MALHELFTASGVTSLRGSGIDWQETAPTLDRRNAQIRIDRNIRAGRHALDGLEEFDAFFDMEFVVNGGSIENFRHFALLAEDYPDAKFLLNTRDKQDWLRDRALARDGLYLRLAKERTGMSDKGVLNMWADDFHRHHDMVRSYFAPQPGRLLEFDIDRTPIRDLKRFVAPDMHLMTRHWQRGDHPASVWDNWPLSLLTAWAQDRDPDTSPNKPRAA